MSYLSRGISDAPLNAEQMQAGDGRFLRLDNFGLLENGFINGDFGIWQRKTAASQFVEYVADRWLFNSSGGAGALAGFSQIALAFGDNPGSESSFAGRLTSGGMSAAGDLNMITQRIENVRRYAGKRVRVSLAARTNSGAGDIVVEARQSFGTGGSADVSGILPAGGQRRITPTALYKRYSVVMDIPSIAGKTIGANSYIDFQFWNSAGSNWAARTDNLGNQTVQHDITDVQIHEVIPGLGDPILPFLRRQPAQELAFCQRYYQILNLGSMRIYVNNVYRQQVPLPVQMRRTPDVTKTATPLSGLGSDTSTAGPDRWSWDLQFTGGATGVIDLGTYAVNLNAEL